MTKFVQVTLSHDASPVSDLSYRTTTDALRNLISGKHTNLAGMIEEWLDNIDMPAIDWQVGDTVLFQFKDGGKRYTYVITDVDYFTTTGDTGLSRQQLDSAWRDHRAALMLRDGHFYLGSDRCSVGQSCTVHS